MTELDGQRYNPSLVIQIRERELNVYNVFKKIIIKLNNSMPIIRALVNFYVISK